MDCVNVLSLFHDRMHAAVDIFKEHAELYDPGGTWLVNIPSNFKPINTDNFVKTLKVIFLSKEFYVLNKERLLGLKDWEKLIGDKRLMSHPFSRYLGRKNDLAETDFLADEVHYPNATVHFTWHNNSNASFNTDFNSGFNSDFNDGVSEVPMTKCRRNLRTCNIRLCTNENSDHWELERFINRKR